MFDLLQKFRGAVGTAAGLTLRYGRYPAYWLQWASRYVLMLFLAFGVFGIPALHSAGAIDIETVNQLGRYLCFAIVALSLDLIWGYGGMLCLCQFLFFTLGGYAMGMYLAHHGGPEGIIDANNWGQIPACLFVVYPGQVGQAQAEWTIPFFWKPFWNLWATLILGLLIPGIVAGLIGFFMFRSRVRGVFFAVVTQAIVLASWNVFCMNDMKLGGTNGLTRFDRIVIGSSEKIEVNIRHDKLQEHQLSVEDIRTALLSEQDQIHRAYGEQVKSRRAIVQQSAFVAGGVFQDPVVTELDESNDGFSVTLSKSLHVWQTRDLLRSLKIATPSGLGVKLSDVAEVNIAGYNLTDNDVKLALYVITVVMLAVVYLLCRLLMKSRIGRVLVAIRDNENRLRFSGYEPYVFKTFIFVVSGMIAGLAGMLYAPQMRIFTPTNLEPKESILVVVWVAVGGRGTLAGPIIGALGVNYLYSYLTSSSPDAWPFVLGALFVGVTRFLPDGLMGLWRKWLTLPLGPSLANAATSTELKSVTTGTERTTRNLVMAAFGLVSAVVSMWLAWSLFQFGGPFGEGLMAKRSGSAVVVGLMVVLSSMCAGIGVPSGIGMLLGRYGSVGISKAAMQGLLGFCTAVVFWCFFNHSFAGERDTVVGRLKDWATAGATDAGSIGEQSSATIVAVVFSLAGLGVCWWVTGGQWGSIRATTVAWIGNALHAIKSFWSDKPQSASRRFAEAFRESSDENNSVDAFAASSDASIPRNNSHGSGIDRTQAVALRNVTTNGYLLHVDRIKVLFDGFKALDVNDFSIGHHELHVIIGPNGAGKTTLCDVISGKTRATEGRVFFSGREITTKSEVEISRLGVGRKFQTPTVFDSLTVHENMELALPGRRGLFQSFSFRPSQDEQSRIDALLNDVGLTGKWDEQVKYLSHGQRQWLEIGMLILNGPRLLLVDEPAAGLTDEETKKTAKLLMNLKKSHSIIVIEHDMDFVRMLNSPVTVLHEGKIMRQGTMDEIENDRDVREAYLGR